MKSPFWFLNALYVAAFSSEELTGRGVCVWIADTGLYEDHVFFDDVDAKNDFFDEKSDERGGDPHGHGTHVTSNVAGRSVGTASGAKVFVLRILDRYGHGGADDFAKALKHVEENACERNVVNLSVEARAHVLIDGPVERLRRSANVVVVAAAGNVDEEGTRDAELVSPCRVATLCVGSSKDDWTKSGGSNWGSRVDLYAPGESIVGALTGTRDGTRVSSGTSMAAAFVSGVVALYWEKYPDFPVEDLVDMIKDDAEGRSLTSFGADCLSGCRGNVVRVPDPRTLKIDGRAVFFRAYGPPLDDDEVFFVPSERLVVVETGAWECPSIAPADKICVKSSDLKNSSKVVLGRFRPSDDPPRPARTRLTSSRFRRAGWIVVDGKTTFDFDVDVPPRGHYRVTFFFADDDDVARFRLTFYRNSVVVAFPGGGRAFRVKRAGGLGSGGTRRVTFGGGKISASGIFERRMPSTSWATKFFVSGYRATISNVVVDVATARIGSTYRYSGTTGGGVALRAAA